MDRVDMASRAHTLYSLLSRAKHAECLRFRVRSTEKFRSENELGRVVVVGSMFFLSADGRNRLFMIGPGDRGRAGPRVRGMVLQRCSSSPVVGEAKQAISGG